MDPFTMCGFLVTPLLTLGLCVADARWAFVLCAAVWVGCLAGNFAFVGLIGRLDLAARLAGSPHLATAGELLQRHGPIAGVMNTILPLPTVPLMVAAHAVNADVTLIVLALAAGRALRYVALTTTVFGGRSAYKYAKGRAGHTAVADADARTRDAKADARTVRSR